MKNKIAKKSLIALAALISVLSISACGGGEPAPTAETIETLATAAMDPNTQPMYTEPMPEQTTAATLPEGLSTTTEYNGGATFDPTGGNTTTGYDGGATFDPTGGNNTTAVQTDVPVTEAPIETTKTTTAPPKNDDGMTALELFANANEVLSKVSSVKIKTNVIGIIPVTESITDNTAMINHSYTIDVTKTATHFTAVTENMNEPDKSSRYEEYQTLNNMFVTTYTKDTDGSWTDAAVAKTMLRSDLTANTLNSIGLVELLNDPDCFNLAKIEKTKEGNWVISALWTDLMPGMQSKLNMFNGIVRIINTEDAMDTIDCDNSSEGIQYVFDKNFVLQSIKCDIIDVANPDLTNARISIEFSDWDKVKKITPPQAKHTVQTTATDDTITE